jgi:hypothetical protein
MFSWLSNKLGLSKKIKTPSPPKPKLLTIFNSITYLSPEGEKTSPINLEHKPKRKKTKSWNKNIKNENRKSMTRAADRLHNDVTSTLGLHKPKPLTQLVSTKNSAKTIDQTRSILKRKRTDGGNKTKKKKTCTIQDNFIY